MPRYIDADALRDALYYADAITMKGVRILNQFPTLSPDEVRGVGEWVDKGVRAWSCSYCGTPLNHIRQFASFEKNELPNYCPSCGARLGNGGTDDS